MRPMRPLPNAVNHIAPSGPAAMRIGWVPLGSVTSLCALFGELAGSMRPTTLQSSLENQMPPSGAVATPVGSQPGPKFQVEIAPSAVLTGARPRRSDVPPVNQRLPPRSNVASTRLG